MDFISIPNHALTNCWPNKCSFTRYTWNSNDYFLILFRLFYLSLYRSTLNYLSYWNWHKYHYSLFSLYLSCSGWSRNYCSDWYYFPDKKNSLSSYFDFWLSTILPKHGYCYLSFQLQPLHDGYPQFLHSSTNWSTATSWSWLYFQCNFYHATSNIARSNFPVVSTIPMITVTMSFSSCFQN